MPTDFVLTATGALQTTANGNLYLVCNTSQGKVAFWGTDSDRRNIDNIQRQRLPVRLRCGCIPSNWSQHSLWVPQGSEIVLLENTPPVSSSVNAGSSGAQSPGTPADDLALWRRRLLRLLDRLEEGRPGAEGPVARITVLKRSGRIPRDTAALMIALAELRNVSEHEGKEPTAAEAAVARNAWVAICEWARGQKIDPEHL